MNHNQVESMEKYLTLKGVDPAEAKKAAPALCGDFDFATKGTLRALKKDVTDYAREGYVKASDAERSSDPIKCCILEICC